MNQKLILIGPAWPLRGGGIATFNERLARQFLADGFEVTIYTFSLQYPSFLFPGSSQYSTEPAPDGLDIRIRINSINPFNWLRVGREIKQARPEIVVVRYWLPLMGPALGTLLRVIRKNRYSKIICIADNVVPHEKRMGDAIFTKYFLQPVHAFITLSEQVERDLRLFTQKPATLALHPLYDNFGEGVTKHAARLHLGLPETEKIILFFGFIRKYKGLDLLLQALHLLKQRSSHCPRLLVAGEFYDNKAVYDNLITQLDIADQLILHTHFITDAEVKFYWCAADFVIQPYRNATQSGITPLAYHFEKPMLVTNVGGLADRVPDGKVGLVVEPNPVAIADGIETMYELGEAQFLIHLREEKKKYNWSVLTDAIVQLARHASNDSI